MSTVAWKIMKSRCICGGRGLALVPFLSLPMVLGQPLPDPPKPGPKPVVGYRFIIKGDFDGDGHQETLTEHYLDGHTGDESPKYYEGIEYDVLVDMAMAKEPISIMTCDKPSVPVLEISRDPQLLGVAFALNEGDLDGDGRDEVSYVVDAADWSNINTCKVVGLRDGKWNELASFTIRESWLPSRPDVQPQFYLFGVAGLDLTPQSAVERRRSERHLKSFHGLIHKLGRGRIRVRTINDEGDGCWKVIRLP